MATLLTSQRWVSAATAASSDGIVIVPSATAHTKGSYTDLIAATAFSAQGISVTMLANGTASNEHWLFDIAVGEAASEQIIIADLRMIRAASNFGPTIYLPVTVPVGVRLSARCQTSATTSNGSNGIVTQLGQSTLFGQFGMQRCVTYGADAATTIGTSIDPGAVAHTKGAYTQLTAATTSLIRWLGVSISNKRNTAHAATTTWLADIAIGAAASEQVIIPDLSFIAMGTNQGFHPSYYSLPIDIPLGSRIAVRAQCDITDATDRLFDVILYGVG